jgi:hypothetical protein
VGMTDNPVDGPVAAPAVPDRAGPGDRTANTEPDLTRPATGQVVIAVVVVAVVGFVLPVVISRVYGSLGIVRNDDWSYLRTLFNWVDTGHLDFNNWVSMTLLSQLVIAAPIVLVHGHDITFIQLETAALGLAGLCLVLWLGFVVTRRLWVATFVGVLVAVGPLWGALAVSFMTDVPAFAVSMLASALGVRAIRRQHVSLPYLVASMAAGLVGFTIRQYAAVPPIAIALVGGSMLWREGSRPRIRAFLIACGTILFGAAVFWAFWRTIPHPKAFSPELPSGHSVGATLYKGTGLVRLVGLLTAPAIVAAGPLRVLRRAWAVARDTTVFVGLGTIAILAFTAWASPSIAFAGNYIAPNGILAQGVAMGHRPDIAPSGVFNLLLGIGSLAAALLVIAIVPLLHLLPQRWRARDLAPHDPVAGFMGLVVAGYALAYFAASIAGIPLYDRYVLPVVPLIAVLLLRPVPEIDGARDATRPAPARRGLAARGALALLALAVVGYVYTADSAAFDGTRWKVAVEATKAGWDRRQIRGGFEWTNFYAGTRVPQKLPYCVLVVIDPARGLHDPRVIAYGYYHSPLNDPLLVVALRTRLPCKPAHAIAAKQ